MTVGLARANVFPRLRHGGWATDSADAFGWTPHGCLRHDNADIEWVGMQGFCAGDRVGLELNFGQKLLRATKNGVELGTLVGQAELSAFLASSDRDAAAANADTADYYSCSDDGSSDSNFLERGPGLRWSVELRAPGDSVRILSTSHTHSEEEAHDYEYSVELASKQRAEVARAAAVSPRLVACGFVQHTAIDGMFWPDHTQRHHLEEIDKLLTAQQQQQPAPQRQRRRRQSQWVRSQAKFANGTGVMAFLHEGR